MFIVLSVTLTGCSTQEDQVAAPSEEAVEKIVLMGGTLIDGTGRDPMEHAVVVIAGKRIEAILPDGSNYQPEPDARVILVEGKFVLPGLIDAHVHYQGWAAPLYAANGITSVVDTGNRTAWILAQRFAIANDLVPGPRIFTCGDLIDSPPGTFSHSVLVSTEEEAREAVKEHVRQGVDCIKIYTALRPPLVDAIIQEAHAANIPVRGHIAISAREAAQFGIDSLEHISGVAIATMDNPEKLQELEERRNERFYLPSTVAELASYMKPELYGDLISLFIQQNTTIAPTLVPWWMGVHPHNREYEEQDQTLLLDPRLSFIPELARRGMVTRYSQTRRDRADPRFTVGYANMQKFVKSFIDAGGKVVAGSDAIQTAMHGVDLHRELELLVESGLSPSQALQAATRNPAELMRQAHDLGTIEPGKLADVIVVDGNPLQDIRNTRNIELVIKEGKILDIGYDPGFLDLIPRPPDE